MDTDRFENSVWQHPGGKLLELGPELWRDKC